MVQTISEDWANYIGHLYAFEKYGAPIILLPNVISTQQVGLLKKDRPVGCC